MIIEGTSTAMRTALLAGLILAALTGCAPAGGRTDSAAAATRFAAALARHDGAVACALLTEGARSALETSSGQSCDKAVLQVHSNTGGGRASVWGDEAEVRVGRDTMFLDHTSSGWRVRAAGCKSQGTGRPYECEVTP